jgi:hypothetical protein
MYQVLFALLIAAAHVFAADLQTDKMIRSKCSTLVSTSHNCLAASSRQLTTCAASGQLQLSRSVQSAATDVRLQPWLCVTAACHKKKKVFLLRS